MKKVWFIVPFFWFPSFSSATGIPKLDAANLALEILKESIQEMAREVVFTVVEKELGISAELTASLVETEVSGLAQRVAMETDTLVSTYNTMAQALVVPPADACSLYSRSRALSEAYKKVVKRGGTTTLKEGEKYLQLTSRSGISRASVRENAIKSIEDDRLRGFKSIYDKSVLNRDKNEGTIFNNFMNRSYDKQTIEDSDWFISSVLGDAGLSIFEADPRDTSDDMAAHMFSSLKSAASASVGEHIISSVISKKRQLSGRKLDLKEFSKLAGLSVDSSVVKSMFDTERAGEPVVNESADLVLSLSMSAPFLSAVDVNKSGADEEVSADRRRALVIEAAGARSDELAFRRQQSVVLAEATLLIQELNRN